MFRGLGIFSLFVLVGLVPNSAFAELFKNPNDAAAAAKAYHRYGQHVPNAPDQVKARYETFYTHLSRLHPTDSVVTAHRQETSRILTEMADIRKQMSDGTLSAKDGTARLMDAQARLERTQDEILTKYKGDMEQVLRNIAKVSAHESAIISRADLAKRLMDQEHQNFFERVSGADDSLLPKAGQDALKELNRSFGVDESANPGKVDLKGQLKLAYEMAYRGVVDYFRHEDPESISMTRLGEFVKGMKAQALAFAGDDVSVPGLDGPATHLTSTGSRPVVATGKPGDGVKHGDKTAVLSTAALTMRFGTPDMVRDFIDYFGKASTKDNETAGTALRKLHDAWVETLKTVNPEWRPEDGKAPEPWMIVAAMKLMPEALQNILKGKSPAEVRAIIKTLVENRCPGSAFFDTQAVAAALGLVL
ncbi:MAG: hypothetical protein KDD51_02315 [Bdellovibrionales bacterium]|nr:hypothetical protein [Bdellovibrionales bacterium]